MNKYLDGNQASPKISNDIEVADELRTAPGPNHSTNSHTAASRQVTAEPCPGCMYNITAESVFDDTRVPVEDDYFGDDAGMQAAGGRRYWKNKTKQSSLLRIKEMLSKVARSCKRTLASLRQTRSQKGF